MFTLAHPQPWDAARGPAAAWVVSNSASSANIRFCLFLIYYFSLCDTALKPLPLALATVLRYLPEALLYLFVLALLYKRVRIRSFPLFWPLCLCALCMTVSGAINHSELSAVASDFRSYFRFSAFAYILWRTRMSPRRIVQFIDGFLGLTVIELMVGGIEMVGGARVKDLFSPALGWGSNSGPVSGMINTDPGTWLAGTLSNYNHYGMFMALSCILALSMYFAQGARRYLWMAWLSASAVVLSISRHALLALIVGVAVSLFFHRRQWLKSSRLPRLAAIGICAVLASVLLGISVPAIRGRVASVVSPDVVGGDPDANVRLFMTLTLTPRFLAADPLFGQGPIPASEAAPVGSDDQSLGPTLKAAPEMPGWVTFHLGDVVWVMVLGLYGCLGLIAFGAVFAALVRAAMRVRASAQNPEIVAAAESCLIAAILFLLAGFFSQEIISRDTIPVFWALAGTVLSLSQGSTPNTLRLLQAR